MNKMMYIGLWFLIGFLPTLLLIIGIESSCYLEMSPLRFLLCSFFAIATSPLLICAFMDD